MPVSAFSEYCTFHSQLYSDYHISVSVPREPDTVDMPSSSVAGAARAAVSRPMTRVRPAPALRSGSTGHRSSLAASPAPAHLRHTDTASCCSEASASGAPLMMTIKNI